LVSLYLILIDDLPFDLSCFELLLHPLLIHDVGFFDLDLFFTFARCKPVFLFFRSRFLFLGFIFEQALRLFSFRLVPDHVKLVLHHDGLVKFVAFQNFNDFGIHFLGALDDLVVDAENATQGIVQLFTLLPRFGELWSGDINLTG
jgi:hypothetical protein